MDEDAAARWQLQGCEKDRGMMGGLPPGGGNGSMMKGRGVEEARCE
jgi:hypothetical protein